MDHKDKRKTSLNDLPPEILESIAMNLYLPDYLSFRALCRRTWSLFGCPALIPILTKIRVSNNEKSEARCEDCHYISRSHILSYAYRKNGPIPKIDDIALSGASLKHVPCGDVIERAARSQNYKALLSWLINHGASFLDVHGGINRLCCEAYEQGNFEKFRWLFPKGASLDILAGVVFDFSGCHEQRTCEAWRGHLRSLKKALREGEKADGFHEALAAHLKSCRNRGLSDAWRK